MRFLTFKRPNISSTLLTVLLAVYFTFGLNFVFFKKAYNIWASQDVLGFGFALSVPLLLIALLSLIFTFFVWPKFARWFFALLVLVSAMVNYAAYTFGVIFNQDMITNIVETSVGESSAYLNLKLIVWLLLSGVVPAALILWCNIAFKSFGRELLSKLIIIVTSLAIVGGIAALYYKDYASIGRNNPKMQKDLVPSYFIASTVKYIYNKYLVTPLPYKTLGPDAKEVLEKNENYLTVFLVGETARAANYPFNGYQRNTTAHTQHIKNIVQLKNTTSCGTATAVSLPCMFSFLGHNNYSQRTFDAQDHVIDVLKRAGIKMVWIDNNTGCKGLCDDIPNYMTDSIKHLHCENENCDDGVFLNLLDAEIAKFNGKSGIVFLHLIGSHGPTYYKRYPRAHAKFQPDCQTSDLQKCTDEQIINSFDNTILYTDYLMAEVIKKMHAYDNHYNTSVLYVSDHGESLGENGIYLHGMPYAVAPPQQTHVPFMMWFSDKTIAHKKLDMACMAKIGQQGGFSHDYISSTLLNLMDVKTSIYRPHQDIIRVCEGVH